MSVEVHHGIDSLDREWDELAERVGAPPFLHAGWFAAWNRAFGGGRPELACVRRQGRLVAVLPLLRRRGALLAAANVHTPMYGALAEDRRAVAKLARSLLVRPPRRLDLPFLPPGEPLRAEIRSAAEAAGQRVLERVIGRSPYIEIEGGWEEFEAGLPTKRRSDLRRRRRRLEEEGGVRFEALDGTERLDELLAEGFEVEASGWKGRRGTAVSSRRETARFYQDVGRWSSARGWLRLWFLRLDDRPLAFAYCLIQGGAHYVLKVGFDPEARPFAPGTLLTREMLASAFSSGLRRYEFLGQSDPYKLVWTERRHELTRLQVFAPTITGGASRLLWERGGPAARKALALTRR